MKAWYLLVSGLALFMILLYAILAEIEEFIDDIRRNTEDDE